ncbi:MAG: hypothetical protein QOG31_373 [Thermoplasmata archaeon]|jgi:hypothetical protein|nr:hypothetical protein [Thermoplasmata archaeon]
MNLALALLTTAAVAVLVGGQAAAADGPLDDWPRCQPVVVTVEPVGHTEDPNCLFPLPTIRPELP